MLVDSLDFAPSVQQQLGNVDASGESRPVKSRVRFLCGHSKIYCSSCPLSSIEQRNPKNQRSRGYMHSAFLQERKSEQRGVEGQGVPCVEHTHVLNSSLLRFHQTHGHAAGSNVRALTASTDEKPPPFPTRSRTNASLNRILTLSLMLALAPASSKKRTISTCLNSAAQMIGDQPPSS